MSSDINQTPIQSEVQAGEDVTKEEFMSSFDEKPVEKDEEISVEKSSKAEEVNENELPEYEKRIRQLQSEKDKYYAELEKTTSAYHEALKKAQFVEELMEDDDVFESFVYTRKPELIEKTQSPSELAEKIVQKLDNEFNGYRPSDRNSTEPEDLLYFKRYDEVYQELSKKKVPKTLTELKAEREQLAKQREEEVQKEVNKAKELMKWDDEKLKAFNNWSKKASLVDLMKVYDYAMKLQKTPSISNAPGTSKTHSARESFLKSFR